MADLHQWEAVTRIPLTPEAAAAINAAGYWDAPIAPDGTTHIQARVRCSTCGCPYEDRAKTHHAVITITTPPR